MAPLTKQLSINRAIIRRGQEEGETRRSLAGKDRYTDTCGCTRMHTQTCARAGTHVHTHGPWTRREERPRQLMAGPLAQGPCRVGVGPPAQRLRQKPLLWAPCWLLRARAALGRGGRPGCQRGSEWLRVRELGEASASPPDVTSCLRPAVVARGCGNRLPGAGVNGTPRGPGSPPGSGPRAGGPQSEAWT